MIERCCSDRYCRNPTYKDCIVCKEWLVFSNFRLWMRTQQWIRFTDDCEIERLTLDKDLLSGGKRGRLYSPETCVFIPKPLNNFLTDNRKSRGCYPLGVYFNRKKKKYMAQVCNPFTKKEEWLGSFDTPEEAQLAYIIRKTEFATRLASEQADSRIAEALLSMGWF
jgi:AP2 domain